MTKLKLTLTAVLLGLLLTGCAAKPQLSARSAGNPAGIDISGRWVLRLEPDAPVGANPAEEMMRLPPATPRRNGQEPVRARRSVPSKGPDVGVFIEHGNLLQIKQTEYGVFVSFDRAVVEEFTFGENREVSLGPIEAQRVSGWEGREFVVETMDRHGVTLVETWGLASDGSQLVRDIDIVDGDKSLFATQQVFDRS